jgi:hypothetical protein
MIDIWKHFVLWFMIGVYEIDYFFLVDCIDDVMYKTVK